ncbi:MAG: C-GCAxxG-C-C family protein [Chloroflexota bacterium]
MLQVLQKYYDIENEDIWRLATGLGAGLSRQGEVCGALLGGTAACGLILGRQRQAGHDDRFELRNDVYAKVQELSRRFRERFGAIECGELTGCDFNTPEGQSTYKEKSLLGSLCVPVVQFVVETVPALCE